MEKYMEEMQTLKEAAELLQDAVCYAKECKDAEREREVWRIMDKLDKIRYQRIERIGTIADQEAGNLLFRLYVDGDSPEEIMRENGWSTSAYKGKLRAALRAYKDRMQI